MQNFTVSNAAKVLDVSEAQVGRLLSRGEILGSKWGRSWMIDAASVHRYASTRPERGRPYLPGRAWAELLGSKVRTMDDAKKLAVLCRRRAERHGVHVIPGFLDALRKDPRVVLSGVDAGRKFKAMVTLGPPVDLYLNVNDVEKVFKKYVSQDHVTDPNVIIRVVESDVLQQFEHHVPLMVALVDLVAEGDYRSAKEVLNAMK
ncbi:MAG: helix-turn-helix domain-containing protein [Actinobacteria bacterium]|nr:helix-turn-helix domain-containing protein [Actinomycetota bacterium]